MYYLVISNTDGDLDYRYNAADSSYVIGTRLTGITDYVHYSVATGDLLFNIINTLTYTVTYNANGATYGTAPSDASSPYPYNATVTVLGNTGSLAKTGNTFSGWNTQADGLGTTYTPAATFNITANTTLYAKWTASTTDQTITVTTHVTSPSTYGSSFSVTATASSRSSSSYYH